MKTRIGQVVLILVFIVALGSWPSWKIFGQPGLVAFGFATGICGVAALVSLVPLVLAQTAHATASGLAQASLLGTILRLFFTLIGGMVVYKILDLPKWPFALWLIIDYIILLFWETWMAVKLMPSSKQETEKRCV